MVLDDIGKHFLDHAVELVKSGRKFVFVVDNIDWEEKVRDGLFQCPNEGCICVYQTYNALENHTFGGKCDLREERTLLDRAKVIYNTKLAEGTDVISTECESSQSTRDPPVKGWALKTTKSSKRFSEAQRSFLDRKFNIGQETGHKLNPASVAKDMRYAKKLDGIHLFQADEFLTATQVQSYFARRTAKSRQQRLEVDFTVEDENYAESRVCIVRNVGLQHPITHNQYNLCELKRQSRLNKFSIALCREICTELAINTDGIPATRKAPYVALLTQAVEGCSCN